MKFNRKILLNILVAGSLAVSCSDVKPPVKVLPSGNIDKYAKEIDSLNTPENEVAPFRRPIGTNCSELRHKDNTAAHNSNLNNGVMPSYKFFPNFLGRGKAEDNSNALQYLTKSVESVSFINANSGFVALSHPPSAEYSDFLNLSMSGNVGGTDLFYFEYDANGKPKFTNLDEAINSRLWDSHPFVGVDSACNLVLVWASDRNHPFNSIINLDNKVIKTGNSDLLYAFRINGKWSDVKPFEGGNINTDKFYEVSPYISCLGVAPRLLFSSNRNNDYDIYSVPVNIDFANQVITANDTAETFPKAIAYDEASNSINTYSDEIFPMVAIDAKGDKILYLSSDRFQKEVKIGKDSLLTSKGKYDIYQFAYTHNCVLPPPPPPPPAPLPKGAVLNVQLVDMLNSGDEINSPVIKLVEVGSGKEVIRKGNSKETFPLEFGKEYEVFGGSERNSLNCQEPGDKLLQYYQAKLITRLEPKINAKVRNEDYDSTISAKLMVAYDTNTVVEWHPVDANASINKAEPTVTKENKTTLTKTEEIKSVQFKGCIRPCDTTNIKIVRNEAPNTPQTQEMPKQVMEVTKQVITKREWYEGGKVIQKKRTWTEYDTIPKFDTTFVGAIGATAKSQLTHLYKISPIDKGRDTVINDVVQLYPQYYVKPPCACDFEAIKHPYNKNVPYFQTAFWKVNTSAGLSEQLQDFQEDGYLARAGYIELHPKHRTFGVAHKEARDERKEEYRKYSQQVDINLSAMRDEITKRFIPAMEALDTLAPGNKILVKLEAYSDIRDAGLCYYIGSPVEYISGVSDKDTKKISLKKISLKNQATLGDDNDNLSKLRVFYGFNELLKRLRWDEKFAKYMKEGLVFYPTQEFKSDEEMQKALAKAKIIILAEGKRYDPTTKKDEKDYDEVRRLNLYIDLIKYEGGTIEHSPCCNPAAECLPIEKK